MTEDEKKPRTRRTRGDRQRSGRREEDPAFAGVVVGFAQAVRLMVLGLSPDDGPPDDKGMTGSGVPRRLSKVPSREWILKYGMDIPLVDLYPPLGAAKSIPVDYTRPLSTRLRNVLVRWRGLDWASYLNVTPSELGARRNAGRQCLIELLTLAEESASTMSNGPIRSIEDGDVGDDGASGRARLGLVAAAAETLASWAHYRGWTTVGPLLDELGRNADLPPDIVQAWEVVASSSLEDFAATPGKAATGDELLHQLLSSLDERQRAIYIARSIPTRGPTLQELADELNLTRERVRQLQKKAEARLSAKLAEEKFGPLRWMAHTLRTRLGDSIPMAGDTYASAIEVVLVGCTPDRQPMLAQFLLRLAGYSERSGWMIHKDAAGVSADLLRAEANEDGLIDVSRATELLGAAGVAPANHAAMLERIGGFRRFDGWIAIWGGSVVDKVVRLLAIRGAPMSPDELVAIIGEGHSIRSLRNRLYDDPRLARVAKNEWALRTWGLDEYTGAADEIAEEIERQGGAASLAYLAEVLASRFGISENSVRTYAQTPRFVVEAGIVRLRAPDEGFVVSATIADAKGCFQDSPSTVTLCVAVDKDVLRGSGRPLLAAVAAFIGLVPGTERRLRATHPGSEDSGQVAITWPVDSAVGPSLGSIRTIAEAIHATEGDLLRLRFDRAEGTIHVVCLRPLDLDSMAPVARLSALTGLESLTSSNALERLAESMSIDPAGLRSHLIRRGDGHLTGLLPEVAIDPDLGVALAELEDALAPLE